MDSPSDFEGIYDRFAASVYNYCCYQLGDVHAAEDIVSGVFEKICLHLDRYDRRRGPMSAWIFAIARNAIRDARRAKSRSRAVSLCSVPDPVSTAPSPEESVLLDDSKDRLLRSVTRLPKRDRDVISLKFTSGFSNRSIGRILGLREGHVAVILHRAVHALRKDLEEEEKR